MRITGGPTPAMLKRTLWPCSFTSARSIVGSARTDRLRGLAGVDEVRRLGAVVAVMGGEGTDRAVSCSAGAGRSRPRSSSGRTLRPAQSAAIAALLHRRPLGAVRGAKGEVERRHG